MARLGWRWWSFTISAPLRTDHDSLGGTASNNSEHLGSEIGRRFRKRRLRLAAFAINALQFARLAIRGFLSAQFCLNKKIDLTIHHRLHIARLNSGAMILYHLVRLKNIRTNLATPGDITLFAILAFNILIASSRLRS